MQEGDLRAGSYEEEEVRVVSPANETDPEQPPEGMLSIGQPSEPLDCAKKMEAAGIETRARFPPKTRQQAASQSMRRLNL